jgi:hypothetical protein
LFNLETASQLNWGELAITAGVRAFGNDRVTAGSALEVYSGSLDYGVDDRLQVGLAVLFYDDPLGRPVGTVSNPSLAITAIAPNFKYALLQTETLRLSLGGSLEYLNVSTLGSNFLGGTAAAGSLGGSVFLPLTYAPTPEVQITVTPQVSILPNTIGTANFFGTIFTIGAGINWQATPRLSVQADAIAPISGNNSVRGSDGSFNGRIVWSGGLRYLVSPTVGLDVYATNALGTTPATRVLSFLPDGDQVAITAQLTFTPDTYNRYARSFRGTPRPPLGMRQEQLLLDGITSRTADTLPPNLWRLRAGGGSGLDVSLAYGISEDAQIELGLGRFDDSARTVIPNLASDLNLSGAAKLRFLDQQQGDPFSLSFYGSVTLFGRSQASAVTGVVGAELIAQYQPTPDLALMLTPKVAIVETTPAGVTLGFNYRLAEGLQLLGEFTPSLGGDRATWAAALRYLLSGDRLGLDVYVTNATGQNTFGSLVARPDGAQVGVNIHWLFGGGR